MEMIGQLFIPDEAVGVHSCTIVRIPSSAKSVLLEVTMKFFDPETSPLSANGGIVDWLLVA